MALFPKGKKRPHGELEAVVAAYERQLLVYAARITGSPSSAEDIVQETFIKLAGKWKGSLEPGPQVSTWLYRVAHNEAIDFIRNEKRRGELHMRHVEERGEIEPPSAGQGAPRVSEEAVRVARALDILSERERNLVVLKVYEERSYKEIAEMTGLSMGNVGFILHTAMKKLVAHLGEKGKGEGNGD